MVYLDDFAGAETPAKANGAFSGLAKLFKTLGLKEAASKACPPSQSMYFLGIKFDTINLTLEVTQKDCRP